MLNTFRYRLYPTHAQRERLESTLETCRRFYNDCLSERRAAYELEGRTVGKVEQLRRVKVHKANNPFATGIHSHILQVVVSDLDKTFQAFFRRIRDGETISLLFRIDGEVSDAGDLLIRTALAEADAAG